MSSGFVSGGTTDAPIERSDEWLAAQQELEAGRQRKAAQARQSDGRSLYETLEANKAAKQEAFEEANRLKNQFRSLDEDEIEFLDSVLESTRAEEERVKRETAEGLELFRRQQEEADKKARRAGEGDQIADAGPPTLEEEQWAAGGRKRKRAKDKEGLKGVKIRRSSSTIEQSSKSTEPAISIAAVSLSENLSTVKTAPQGAKSASPTQSSEMTTKSKPEARSGMALVDYGSDEDDA